MLVYYNEFPGVCKVFFYSVGKFSCWGEGIEDSGDGSGAGDGFGAASEDGSSAGVVSSGAVSSGWVASLTCAVAAAGVSDGCGAAEAAAGWSSFVSVVGVGVGFVFQTPVWAVKVTSAVRVSQAP